eukprot:CAMPEP_0182534132 /NCGR_PEP_ID=MMETSP1323-20130603/15146_1 /TAXON_ID=236787 /ORGANISM="Florenciella parvula, Strain RCC1693" /LENGTH=114 /DNA_ID=CAMNT_0024744109 /DNA_START=151 /DNA_END=496 /DNA_ORIENTATION=+
MRTMGFGSTDADHEQDIKYQTDADHRDEGGERRHVAPTNTRASPGAGVIELLNNQPAVAVVLRLRRAEGATWSLQYQWSQFGGFSGHRLTMPGLRQPVNARATSRVVVQMAHTI